MTFAEYRENLLSSGVYKGQILENESLSSHSTMNAGGTAKLFVAPETESSLVYAVKLAKENSLDFFILGGGSNTIFPDEGLPLVITTRQLKTFNSKLSTQNSQLSTLCLSSGISWGSVLSFCKNNDLSGFEPFTALSGTVGGAVYMNATCFGLTTSDNLLSVNYLDLNDCTVKTYIKDEKEWGYKKSPFQQDDKLILSAEFKVTAGFDQLKSTEVKEKRIAMGHFKAPSAGSAFKNNPEKGIIAGKLIDECGLKGFSIGGAQIAPWHGNFIINPEKKATCSDIKALVQHVQKIVLDKTGVQMEPEILFV